LVDLRGHGLSTGDRIFFGLQETNDLSRLLDELQRNGQLAEPVAAIGESYGAALSLRWKTVDPRVQSVVAIAPYASLSNATLNLGREYARWFPQFILKAGLKRLPTLLDGSTRTGYHRSAGALAGQRAHRGRDAGQDHAPN
jgi:pimeloyl-ACP methyl ester carboxylesterase